MSVSLSTSATSGTSGASAPEGLSGTSNQAMIAASNVLALVTEMAVKLQQKNEDASTLRQMKTLATALDGLRSDGVVKLTKADKDGNEVVDVNKVQYLLDYIKANNQNAQVDPDSKMIQITAFNGGNAKAADITVEQLKQFDLKVDGISLFAKETASSALSALGNKISAKLQMIEKDGIDLTKNTNNYKQWVGVSAALIDMITKIMDMILQRM